MSTWKLTKKVRSDFAEILLYTIDTWGEQQAENYVEELARCFQLLADSPGLGRACDLIFRGIRRFELGKHVIFYKPDRNGIIVSRILHQRLLPTQSQFMDS